MHMDSNTWYESRRVRGLESRGKWRGYVVRIAHKSKTFQTRLIVVRSGCMDVTAHSSKPTNLGDLSYLGKTVYNIII